MIVNHRQARAPKRVWNHPTQIGKRSIRLVKGSPARKIVRNPLSQKRMIGGNQELGRKGPARSLAMTKC